MVINELYRHWNTALTCECLSPVQSACKPLSQANSSKLHHGLSFLHGHSTIDEVGSTEGWVRADDNPSPHFDPVLLEVLSCHPQPVPSRLKVTEVETTRGACRV